MNFCPHCGEPAIPVAQQDENATSPIEPNTQYAEETQQIHPQPQPYQPQPYQQPYQQSQQPYQQPQQPYQQPHPSYQPRANGSGGGNAKWIVIGLLGGLLIGLAGFLAWMFLTNDKSNDQTATNTAVEQKTGNEAADQDNLQQNDQPQVQHDTVVVERVVEKPVIVETKVQNPVPKNQRSYAGGSGRWPFTSTRYLDPSELYGMSAWDKKIMRNEIYARHGYIFQTRDMINYFNSQPWYTPISRNVRLSKIEQYNVQLIKSVE
jgi:hypothetical protein